MQHQTARAALRSASAQTAPLVITPTLPPVSGRDEQGVNRRLGLFLGALGSGGAPIRILRLVRDSLAREWEGRLDELSSRESQYWGLAVDIRLIARRSRAETFLSHYVRGITDAAQQPDFFPFGGPQAVQAIAAELDRCAGIVFVHRLPAMAAVLQTRRRPARLFFDLDDVEHRMRLRQALQRPIWPGKLLYAAHAPALLRAEQRGAAISRATFVCSDRDRAHLARLGVRRVASLPNAVRFPATVPPLADAPTILYLGVMSYAPNIAAAERLARRIMPLVWQAAPRARLLVAGDGSRELPSATGGDPRVEYLGYVPDLDALYARARLVCCPITNGGGTRIKLIEAAAYGRAMVATRIGAEGLAFKNNAEILLRDDDAGLAEACVRLLADDAACAAIGRAANARALALYDSSHIQGKIRTIFAPMGTQTAPAPALARYPRPLAARGAAERNIIELAR